MPIYSITRDYTQKRAKTFDAKILDAKCFHIYAKGSDANLKNIRSFLQTNSINLPPACGPCGRRRAGSGHRARCPRPG